MVLPTYRIIFFLLSLPHPAFNVQPVCPTTTITIQSWQSPCTTMYLMCSHQVELLDRAGNIQKAEEDWSEDRKMTLVDIQQQNWDQPALVPQLTPTGFEVRPVPSYLFHFLINMLVMDKVKPEPCPPSGHHNCQEGEDPAKFEIVDVKDSRAVKKVLGEQLKSVAEEWAGIQLDLSTVYGVRRYRRGAKLALHVDKLPTHVVSFIINLGQEVDRDNPWYLDILDSSGVAHKVVLKQGEMILYESARLPHGRTQALNGDSYMNIFVHFRPTSGWYEDDWDLNWDDETERRYFIPYVLPK